MHALMIASSTAVSMRILNACPVCGALRYKISHDEHGDVEGERPRKKIPAKVMWYAPIIPRLKRLFQKKSM